MARTRQDLKKLIEDTKNEADLTDDELQSRLGAFEELGAIPTETIDNKQKLADQIKSQIIGSLNAENYQTAAYWMQNDPNAANIGNEIVDRILAAQEIEQFIPNRIRDITNANNPGAIESKNFSTLKAIGTGINRQFTDAVRTGYATVTPQQNVTEDVKRLQDLISTRKTAADKEGAIQSYLTEDLPSALTARREEYLGGATDRARGMFEQEIVPATMKEANVRGLLRSGYPETALTSKALNVQSDLDSLRAGIESKDYAFLADAAYQNKVRQLLEGQTDYRSALLSEQNKQLLEQGYRFEEGEAATNRNFQEKITQQNYQLQLKQQDAALRRQNDQYKSQQRSDLFNTAASAGGQIIGTYVANKAFSGNKGSGGSNNNTSVKG